jgi:hypothetical protein
MGTIADQLLSYAGSGTGYGLSFEDNRDHQVAALSERFQEQSSKIKLVKLRAQDAEITEITSLGDFVPLLLPHTVYKSHPESFLTKKKWGRLTKWLGTVSAYSNSRFRNYSRPILQPLALFERVRRP